MLAEGKPVFVRVGAHVSTLIAHRAFSGGPTSRSFLSFQYFALAPITAFSRSQLHFTMHSVSERHLRNTIKVSYEHSREEARDCGVKCALVCGCEP